MLAPMLLTEGSSAVRERLLLAVVLSLAWGGSGAILADAGALPPVALELDGSRDFVSIHDAEYAQLDGTERPFSLSFWFRAERGMIDNTGIVNFITDGRNDHQGLAISWYGAPDRVRVRIWPNRESVFSGGIDVNRWHFFAFTFDGHHARSYIDGDLRGELEYPDGNTVSWNGQIDVGRYRWNDEHFRGRIADFRLWEGELSGAEVLAVHEDRLAGPVERLVGHWPLDEGRGTTAEDRTPRANPAVFEGSPRWVLSQPFQPDLPQQTLDARGLERLELGPVRLQEAEGEVSYQWYRDQTPIEGAVGDTLRLQGPQVQVGSYYVRADDGRELTPVESARVHVSPPDWPMWRFDAARSAETPHRLAAELHLQWVRELPAPQRAWPDQYDDRGRLEFDRSYAPVVKGRRVFVPSNVTDGVTAYAIEDGTELWRFTTDGPVRLAPAAGQGRVYFVSDDGHLYCVDAASGREQWRFRGGPSDQRLLGNQRIINFWAARGGPALKEGTVYFAAGLWPLHGVFVYALDAETGDVQWVNDATASDYVRLPHSDARGYGGLVPQGYLAVSEDQVVVAGGRTPPVYLDRQTGELQAAAFRTKQDGDYAVHAGGMGRQQNSMLVQRVADVQDQLDGPVFYKLAAQDRLIVTTDEGTLYCFGPEPSEPVRHVYQPQPLAPRTGDWSETAAELLADLGESEGYALLLGAGSGDLLRELLVRSELHAVVVEADGERVAALRDQLIRGGQYGTRAAVIHADPAAFAVQPYLFSLIASEDAGAVGLAADPAAVARLLDRLRPYGGTAWLAGLEFSARTLEDALAAAEVQPITLQPGPALRARRDGPLPGAGQWTHQYADSANTNFSPDRRVQVPLGVLWFGGPCNNNILPRHGHGPVPQVAGGRMILPGIETISARCVYTGRQLWEREFPGIGHPFTDQQREEAYRAGQQVSFSSAMGVGANQLGSPFVTLPDAVYVRYRTRVYRLAPESGETVAEFDLPVAAELAGQPDWGHLSVCEDWLITTVEPQVFTAPHYSEVFESMADVGGRVVSGDRHRDWDGSSSQRLVVLDRHSGQIRWSRAAEVGFRHNAIVSGGGRLYVIDGLSADAADRLARRGQPLPDATLIALQRDCGRELWRQDSDVFGTWLGYSQAQDRLLMGGRWGGLRWFDDEPRERLAVFHGGSGQPLWERNLGSYYGPLALGNDQIYVAPAARSGSGKALHLSSGETVMRTPPSRDQPTPWGYHRRYGCNTHNVSTHLMTFRSGYAGYFDLKHDSGTGNFAGFRSGCTNNLVVADGVVSAPDYTRTCTCSYAHQTSLALIPMPEDVNLEFWTRYEGAYPDPRQHGLNFGAPGRRVDSRTGRIWHDRPGTSRRHASAIRDAGDSHPWVLASVHEAESDEQLVIEDVIPGTYRLQLHFAELDDRVAAGMRVFDVLADDRVLLEDFDMVTVAGGPLRGVVREFRIRTEGPLHIRFRPAAGSTRGPAINGIELIAQPD